MNLKMQLSKHIIQVILFFGLLSNTLVGQNISVSGTVYDADTRDPIPGAAVVILNSTQGVVSDFDGNFSIQASIGQSLSVSAIGYQTTTIEILQKDTFIIRLVPNNELDEIVVVGYGSQKRSNVVGSVASVDVDQAIQTPTTNVSELLRGRAAGVQVNLGDARPGGNSNIVIRGNVSVAGGNNPLIIVDGLPYDNLNDIAPEDI